jgi:hypothetical protein
MGSRVSTDSRNTLCPRVLYGLPLGRRTLSPLAAHAGHFPVPSCSSGQPGVEHTRHAMCYFPFAPLPLFEPSRPSFDVPLLGLPPIRSPLRVDAKLVPARAGSSPAGVQVVPDGVRVGCRCWVQLRRAEVCSTASRQFAVRML